MVGGQSNIFHHYHKAGKTMIREHEMSIEGKDMPIDCGIRGSCIVSMGHHVKHAYWIVDDAERKQDSSSSKMAMEWLEWKAHEGGIHIHHQMNNAEKHTGERRIPVDGFHGPSQTVFHFHDWFWHNHNCHLTKGKEMNELRKRPMAELLKETKATSK